MRDIKQKSKSEIKEHHINNLQEKYNNLYIENKQLKEKLRSKTLTELGYMKSKNVLGGVVYYKEDRQWREDGILKIEFDEDGEKLIYVSFKDSLPVFLNIDELKAIIKELEE